MYSYLNFIRVAREVLDVQEWIGTLQVPSSRHFGLEIVEVELQHIHRERRHRLIHERALFTQINALVSYIICRVVKKIESLYVQIQQNEAHQSNSTAGMFFNN